MFHDQILKIGDFFLLSLQVAAIMNERFINVKVDREERPDVDKVYMSFVQATTGGGGWPMSVFLTPKLKPIYGGTYYPPEDQVLFRVTRNGHFGPFYSVNEHFWKLFGH